MPRKKILSKEIIPVSLRDEYEGVSGFMGEFKKFIKRGNVMDLAVGVVIGAAFKEIVDTLVSGIIMPPIGLITKNVDFNDLFFSLNGQTFKTLAEAEAAGAPVIKYGAFINSIIDFIIIAFVIFLVIKWLNRLERKEEIKKEPNQKQCPYCFTDINIQATRCPNCTSKL